MEAFLGCLVFGMARFDMINALLSMSSSLCKSAVNQELGFAGEHMTTDEGYSSSLFDGYGSNLVSPSVWLGGNWAQYFFLRMRDTGHFPGSQQNDYVPCAVTWMIVHV
jgi:hypothetical protein